MSFVNKFLRQLKPYSLASHEAWTVSTEERKHLLKLDWNEATVSPSPKVKEHLIKLMEDGSFFNLYPVTSNPELLRLLSEYVHLPEENIQYFGSSDSLHEYIVKLYISVGDPVFLLGPTYDNFRLAAEVGGGNVSFYTLDESFDFQAEAFCRKVRDMEPSLVYICNPNNPTGTVHSVSFVRHLLETFPETLFVIDEAYVEFDGASAKELVPSFENLLITRTLSKAFALANFRFGYLLASRKNIEYISRIRNPKNIPTFTQEAAIGALSDIPYMERYVEEVREAKCVFVDRMEKHSGQVICKTGGGNFLLMKFNTPEMKAKCVQVLHNHQIYVRSLSQTTYLRDYFIRLTVGTCSQMERVANVLDDFFGEQGDGTNCFA